MTPRDQNLTQGINSASRSLGLEDSLHVSEVPFHTSAGDNKIVIDVSSHHDNYLNSSIYHK